MKRIKIYGERNTGTNFLSRLLKVNFETHLIRGTVPHMKLFTLPDFFKNIFFRITADHNLGWKHAKVNMHRIKHYSHLRDTGFITLTKNPYTFLLSLYNRPYHYKSHKPDSFEAFLKSKWHVQGRDEIEDKFLPDPVTLWNIKNRSYIDLKNALPNQALNLKYEDLLANPEEIAGKIADYFTIRRSKEFRNILKSTKPDNRTFSDYQKYYLQEEWKNKLNGEQIGLINERLDTELMTYFRYETLDQSGQE